MNQNINNNAISLANIAAVTNRHLLSVAANESPFTALLHRIEALCHTDVEFIILREKDLSVIEYEALATQAIAICNGYHKPLVLHGFYKTALKLGHPYIHLSLDTLNEVSADDLELFEIIGVSVHSLEDAKKAESLGAAYLALGNIYETNCKKGLPGKGLDFLQNVCDEASVPVYAIGGITPTNIEDVMSHGAAGGLIMSGLMQS